MTVSLSQADGVNGQLDSGARPTVRSGRLLQCIDIFTAEGSKQLLDKY